MKKRLDLSPYEFEIFNAEKGEKEIVTVRSLIAKESFANILGNSKCGPRESYERNKLGDRILIEPNDYIDLTIDEFKKLEDSLNNNEIKIPREHKYLLYRVFEAKEIPDNEVRESEEQNVP